MFNDRLRAMQRKPVEYKKISADEAGQRLDNYLLHYWASLPKSHLYRLIRKGEIRVNKKRIDPAYRLAAEDILRLPPIELADKKPPAHASSPLLTLLRERVLLDDDELLILNKPSGLPVHAGSTVKLGVIEAMRQAFPLYRRLELAHRLDTETSGCLILAKRNRILREVHELLRAGKIKKTYLALTQGHWKKEECSVDLPLKKNYTEGGLHVVRVQSDGKTAQTQFYPKREFKNASLVSVNLLTGRTHQIRVHAAHQDHPLALDDRYGNREFNKDMRQYGLSRLFLHAYQIEFTLPSSGRSIKVEAPLDKELVQCLERLPKK